ncbi:MAG TPA: thermonuclease family protein [Vicinamibacterales bacterium]|nr:thermonuclease family protein [Vicinamibacterales bacterium]
MQFLLMGLAAMLLNLQPRHGLPRLSDPVLVHAVVDGDTINVQALGRVNLLGIEAPVIGHGASTSAPFAIEAKARLTALVLNRWVRLETDTAHVGVTSHRVAYVLTEDGQFINARLVREGLARVSARTPLARLDELQRAEREAQETRRGIWGGTPQIPATGYTAPPVRVPKRPR